MIKTSLIRFPDCIRRTQFLCAAVAFLLLATSGSGRAEDVLTALVGRWDFDDGTGRDLSGHGADAVLGGTRIHPLGEGHACIEVLPGDKPLRIPALSDSPLAISRGTVCLWLNMAWVDSPTVLEYSNGAVQFRIYRRHFQPRFIGEDDFKYSSGILDYDWPKYDMREWAFYPHVRAAVGDSQWHHFAVAYDDQAKKIIGWRDGELISIVDLSAVAMKPLVRKGLKEIVVGSGFAGFTDDIRIYNRVLTDADMREIFNATKSAYEGRSDTIPTDKKTVVYKYQNEDHSLYWAWLQYNPPSKRLGEDLLNRIVAEGSNSTVRTAATELTDAVVSMFDFKPSVDAKLVSGSKVVLGTAATSSWIRDRADKLELDRIRNDGFIIKALESGSDPTLVIAGYVPAGVIFGIFDLIRRIQLGQDLRKLDVLENPKIPIRMIDHWSFFRGFKYDDWRGGRPGTLDGAALTRSSKVKKGTGDKGIALKLCGNIEIRNLNIREGGHYAILATGCEDMLIDNVTIKTSRDGLNLSQCKDVLVVHCHIDAVRYEDGHPAGGGDAGWIMAVSSGGENIDCLIVD